MQRERIGVIAGAWINLAHDRVVTGNEAIGVAGQALDLSERTVHRHCESIFGKLGIRSRWQLGSLRMT